MNLVVLRVVAVAIAVMAFFDPALTSMRPSRPLVSIVASSPGQVSLANRIAASLSRQFTVVTGPMDGAAGTVLVGRALPDESTTWTGLMAAVTPSARSTNVAFAQLEAPDFAPLNSRVPVSGAVVVTGARGRTLIVSLRAGGATVDTVSAEVDADTGIIPVDMTFVPTSASPAGLTAIASIAGSPAADSATIVVEPRDERYRVLFFDLRPSWSSTFVRRAIEDDPRFIVTSRVRTSRGISNTSGTAPVALADVVPDDYATIVIGSPDQLTTSDAGALERFMRERGGRVVLLLDGRVTGSINRLTGVANWSSVRLENASLIPDSSGSGLLRARELAWPSRIPAAASAHAWRLPADSLARAIVWSVPVGAGRLLVNGALDSWHYRDPGMSGFGSFWTDLLARLSASAPPTVGIVLSRNVLAPGEETTVRVTVRSASLSDAGSVEVRAIHTNGTDSTFIRLWPAAEQGVMEGRVVAPANSGFYRLEVTAGSEKEATSFVVDPTAHPPAKDEPDVISAFVSSRGGFAIDESQVGDLAAKLTAALEPVSRVESWYPMRSAWWLIPFTALLGAEWWWRRRRGLA